MQMTFISLPTELLGQISALISGNDACRLWICGDKRLNYRLQTPGVVSELRIVWDKPIPATIPQIVSFFPHLESFSIQSHPSIITMVLYQISLQPLPTTLRKLRIVAKAISNAPYRRPDLLNHILGYSPLKIQEKFPNLESLSLLSYYGATEGPMRPLSLQTVRPPLKSLFMTRFEVNQSNPASLFFNMNGPIHQLTTFRSRWIELSRNMDLADPTEDFTFLATQCHVPVLTWPKSITSIRFRYLPRGILIHIPSTLTQLDIPRMTWDNTSFATLPPSLTDFRTKSGITVNHATWENYTPQQLRILHAKSIIVNSGYSAPLPPSLTELKLHHIGKSYQIFLVGKARLVTLQIPSTKQIFGENFWDALPTSLTDLQIHVNLHPITHLPRNLLRLSIACSPLRLDFGRLFSEVSPGMSSLALYLRPTPELYTTFDVTALPTYLTSLSMTCEPKLTEQDFSCLPRQLVLLSLRNPNINQDANHLACLRKSALQTLFIHVGPLTAMNLKSLPPSLRDLSLRFCGFSDGSESQIGAVLAASLPRNLLRLILIPAFGFASLYTYPGFRKFIADWSLAHHGRILKSHVYCLTDPWPY